MKKFLINLCQVLGVAHQVHFTGLLQVSIFPKHIAWRVFHHASEIETQGIVLKPRMDLSLWMHLYF
jgi:hypothetical protein